PAQVAVAGQSDQNTLAHGPMLTPHPHHWPIAIYRVSHQNSDMRFSLDLLPPFLAVHRTGSITAAAHTLGLCQPAVTAQIKALEAALGRPLFDRLPRGVAPTAAADELARRIAGAIDTLEAVAGQELPTGSTVHLGGPAEFLSTQVVPMLAPLVREGLRLRVTFGLSDDLLAAL